MRMVSFVLVTLLGLAQSPDNATRIVQDVADSAANTSSWRIQGSIRYSGSANEHAVTEFKLSLQSPSDLHFEQTGESPAIIVCTGPDAWTYSPPLRRYRKEQSLGNELCSPFVGEWKRLPKTLQSPILKGGCGPEPDIPSSAFKLVRGFSKPELASVGQITRELCIDPDRKVVVWEEWESQYSTRVYVYSSIDQNVKFDSETFTFEPPPNSIFTDFELPTPRPLGTRGLSTAPDISLPRLALRIDANYGKASRKARIEGIVVLYAVIGSNGVPNDVLVYRSVSPDLDLEAVKAVRQWRFHPGARNGIPVALPVMIEVNFRLLH